MTRKAFLFMALIASVAIPAQAGVKVGDSAPEISAAEWSNLPMGMKSLPQEYLKGQIVMLEFWATW